MSQPRIAVPLTDEQIDLFVAKGIDLNRVQVTAVGNNTRIELKKLTRPDNSSSFRQNARNLGGRDR